MPSLRTKIKEITKKLRRVFFWSGIIKTIGVEYILFLTPMVSQY
jgi:hypothetical protein